MRSWLTLLIRGGSFVWALAALVLACDLYLRPDQMVAPVWIALALAVSAVGFWLGLHLWCRNLDHSRACQKYAQNAADEVAEYCSQSEALQQRLRGMQQRLDVLTAHDNLSRAAGRFSTLNDFLDEIARLVRDMSDARDLTVYLLNAEAVPVPRVYYQLGETTELCLSFSEDGADALATLMAENPSADSVLDLDTVSIDRLNTATQLGHVVVHAGLLQKGVAIGQVRLSLLHYGPERAGETRTFAELLAREVSLVRLNAQEVEQALAGHKSWHYDTRARTADIAAPLKTDDEPFGVIKMRFALHGADETDISLRQRQTILAESARHLAKIIHNERIYEQAIKDGMTGLFNKRHMLAQLEQYLQLSRRHHKKLAIIMLDIDHFKKVNDTYGHLTGDIVLKEVSGLLRRAIRDSDLGCRYGGEELSVILPEGDKASALEVAERLRKSIESYPFVSDQGQPMKVTASLGVSAFDQSMQRPEDLIQAADKALYIAKESGRNRVICAGAEMAVEKD